MEESGEFLFHADRSATASYVAGEREKLFEGDKVGFFHAGGFCGLFEVDFAVTGDNADEVSRVAVALKDESFENAVDVFAELLCDVLSGEVVFVDRVGDEAVVDFGAVEKASGVGFFNLRHKRNVIVGGAKLQKKIDRCMIVAHFWIWVVVNLRKEGGWGSLGSLDSLDS